jgi:hypothetical protein
VFVGAISVTAEAASVAMGALVARAGLGIDTPQAVTKSAVAARILRVLKNLFMIFSF